MKISRSIVKHVMIISSLLLCSSGTTVFGAQEVAAKASRFMTTLKDYGAKMQSSLQKITDCLQGKASCTQTEIRKARTYAGILAAALLAMSLTGVGVARKKEPTAKPVLVPTVTEEQEFTVESFSKNVENMTNERIMQEVKQGKFDIPVDELSKKTVRQWIIENWNNFSIDIQQKLNTAGVSPEVPVQYQLYHG